MVEDINGSFYQDYTFSQDLIIDKDGTFEKSDFYSGAGVDYFEGIWYFAGKNKEMDMKNKEGLVFGYTHIETFSGFLLSHTSYDADKGGEVVFEELPYLQT